MLSVCCVLQPPELHPYNFPELMIAPLSPLTEHDHQVKWGRGVEASGGDGGNANWEIVHSVYTDIDIDQIQVLIVMMLKLLCVSLCPTFFP